MKLLKFSFWSKVKKALLSGILSLLLVSNVSAFMPTFDATQMGNAIAQIVQQIKDYSSQIDQYINMYYQLESQVKNLQMLGNYEWDDLTKILTQTQNIMNQVNGISYDINNVGDRFEEHYKSISEYFNDLDGAESQKERNKQYQESYKNIIETNQNTFKATMQKLEKYKDDIEADKEKISNLKSRSTSADGQLKALQVTNDLIAEQIAQTQKLRLTMMDQTSMLTAYYAAQNNKYMLQKADDDIYFKDMENPYENSNFNEVSKNLFK